MRIRLSPRTCRVRFPFGFGHFKPICRHLATVCQLLESRPVLDRHRQPMGCLGACYAKPVGLCCVVTTINSCSYMPLSSTKDCLPRTQGHAFVTRVHSKGTMLHVDLTSTSSGPQNQSDIVQAEFMLSRTWLSDHSLFCTKHILIGVQTTIGTLRSPRLIL